MSDGDFMWLWVGNYLMCGIGHQDNIYIYIYIKEISYTIGNITIIIYIIFKINCFMFVFKILTITIKPDIFYIFKNLIKIED